MPLGHRHGPATRLALVAVFLIIPVASVADTDSDKPVVPTGRQRPAELCAIESVSQDWDFAEDDHGFVPVDCDASGLPVWEHGLSELSGTPVWGTVLLADYPNDAGSGLRSPTFTVTSESYLVEVTHTFDMEWEYDGANVTIDPHGTVVAPIAGYTVPEISPSPSYTPWCVDGEPGWTGSSSGWRTDCFDLSAFMGQSIAIELDFGSDISVTGPGWYVSSIRVGGDAPALAACCDPVTDECSLTLETTCLEMGGEWHAGVLSCDPDPCAPLAPPSNVQASTIDPSSVLVSWDDDSPFAESYRVERKEGPGGSWELMYVAPGDATSWEDATVLEDQPYYYRLVAVAPGEQSDVSNYTTATPGIVPAAPSDFMGIPAPSAVFLTWSDNSSEEMGFQIQRRDGEFVPYVDLLPHTSASLQFRLDQGLLSEHVYWYRIRAYNQYGFSAWVESGSITTPSDPGSFQATIHVAFGTQDIVGATVELDRGIGFFPEGTTDANGNFTATGLKIGDRVRAWWKAKSWNTCRGYNGELYSDLGRQLYLDTDVMDAQGDYHTHLITGQTSPIDLSLRHTLYRYDLGIATEWDIPTGDAYWSDLATALQDASNYLFNASDGQIALGRVVIYDAHQRWDDVDVHILHSVHPHADTGQFMDCDDWSDNEHFYVEQTLSSGWPATFAHEFGHYALNLKDEYETVIGGYARLDQLKRDQPLRYPSNFGFMDVETGTTEMSSRNDYLTNYDYGCAWISCWEVETEQLSVRGKSCWEQLEGQLEGDSGYADIVTPQAGWFVNGASTSPDRAGPTAFIGLFGYGIDNGGTRLPPTIEVEIADAGPGSFSSTVRVSDERGPAAGARVYGRRGETLTFLGETDPRGWLHAVGLKEGDALSAYLRTGTRTRHGALAGLTSRDAGSELALRLSDEPEGGEAESSAPAERGAGADGPGASVSLAPTGTTADAGFEIDVWADESLADEPTVTCFCGSAVTMISMEYVPSEDRWTGTYAFDLDDPLFDRTGTLEIWLEGTSGGTSIFTTAFVVDEAEASAYYEAHLGSSELNVPGDELESTQLVIAASSNAVAHGAAAQGLLQVSDLYAVHLVADDVFAGAGGMNLAYDDSLLAGIDETTLAAFRWNEVTRTWDPLLDGLVSTRSNVVSAPVPGGGVYAVLGTAMSDDLVPPGRIDDLGAVGVPGGGTIEVLWTATGDDGLAGTLEGYVVAYADSPLVETDWDLYPQIAITATPGAPGSPESAVLELPEEGHLYHLAIRGKDEASNLSPLSNVAFAVSGASDPNRLPAPPTDMRAVDTPGDGGGSVTLTWDLSLDDGAGKDTVTGYRIYRGAPPSTLLDSLDTVPASTDAYVDPGVENRTTYTYWVSAIDGVHETIGPSNLALPAVNVGVPVADFTSDGIVGVDDLSHLLTIFARDATDPEFDPLFDLNGDDVLHDADADSLETHFGEGGVPTSDPPGENGLANVYYETIPAGGTNWLVNVSVQNVSNLAGYSLAVTYPAGSMTFVSAMPDSGGSAGNILTRNGGETPVFVTTLPETPPGRVLVANALQRPSESVAPEGDGFLAQLLFDGTGAEMISVDEIVLLDHERRLDVIPTGLLAGQDPGAVALRPFLAQNRPNPFRKGTRFRFGLVERSPISLRVYDVQGRQVRSLVSGTLEPGVHDVTWDGRSTAGLGIAPGVYFVRLESASWILTRKLVRLP